MDCQLEPPMKTVLSQTPGTNPQTQWNKHLLPIRLQWRVYLFGFLLVALLLLAVGIGVWVLTASAGFRQVENQIDQGLLALERELDDDGNDLEALGNWLVANAEFVRAVREHDQQVLNRQVQPIGKTSIVDLAIVADENGTVLAQISPDMPRKSQDEVLAMPGFKEALSGTISSRLVKDNTGRFFLRKILPVYDGKSTMPIAVLILGLEIDSLYLRRAANRKGIEYVIVSDNRFVQTTLTDRFGRPWDGSFASVTLMNPLDQLFSRNLPALLTDQGQYLFKFRALNRLGNADVQMIGAGISMRALDEDRGLLLRVAGFAGVVGTLGIFLLGYFFAKHLTKPLNQLIAAIERMNSGDLGTKVGVRRADEIGDLGKAIETYRKHQLQTYTELGWQLKWHAAMINAMSAPVVVTNAKNQIEGVNSSALALMRIKGEDPLGQPWHTFFAISDAQADMMPFWHPQAQANGDTHELVVRGRFPLRTQPDVILDITSTQVTVDNVPEGYVHILHDVSEAEQFSRTKDEFLLNVAHEMKGPLASWRASLESLLEEYTELNPRELGVLLKRLERGVIRFEGLIDILIDIGKLQAGRFKIRTTPVRILNIVQDGISTIDALLKAKGQTLEMHVDSPATCMVLADRGRIAQVVVNLLKNANKYGPEDSVIEVYVYRQGEFVFVEVRDHGEGIPAEDQAQLFTRFFRGKRAEEEGGGLGIGLALSKGIIEAHHGQVGVRSQVEQGSTFWFSLPELNSSSD